MLVMIGYIFINKMVKKMQNAGLEIVAGLTRPLICQHHVSVFQCEFMLHYIYTNV